MNTSFDNSIYVTLKASCSTRDEYLKKLADAYEVSLIMIEDLANKFGPDGDCDKLIIAIEDAI